MSESPKPNSNIKLIITVIVALAGAFGISVSVSDDSPVLKACSSEAPAQPVAGAPAGVAGSVSQEDAGAE